MAVPDDLQLVTPELMLAFYRRLYPFKSLFTWLNHEHAPTKLFTNREFAFTLQGDVYLRYNSFSNAEELKKQVCALNPTRFEIGPVYSARVSSTSPSTYGGGQYGNGCIRVLGARAQRILLLRKARGRLRASSDPLN